MITTRQFKPFSSLDNFGEVLEKTKSKDYITQIYYEDTDFTGLVYHSNYLKYFERAREEALGVDTIKRLYNEGLHMVVRSVSIKYKNPAHYGFSLTVKNSFQMQKNKILVCDQNAYETKTCNLLVSAIIKVIMVDKYKKHTVFPHDFINHIKN